MPEPFVKRVLKVGIRWLDSTLMKSAEHWEEPRQFIPRSALVVEVKSRRLKKLKIRKRAIVTDLGHSH